MRNVEDLRLIIAKNISTLRRAAAMTQFDLAERLNYSDKAVSKWERGESVPDIAVLKNIADIFSVTVDYLLEEEHSKKRSDKPQNKIRIANRGFITGMAVTLVWLVALLAFVTGDMFREQTMGYHWLAFLWAAPITFIVWLVLNSVWFNRRLNFLIVSFLMWACLTSIHISLILLIDINIRFIYLLGVPGQIIILFWSFIRSKKGT